MIRTDTPTLPQPKAVDRPVIHGDADAISALLVEWLNDSSEYDGTVWPIIEQELNEDRLEMERGDAPGA